MYLSDKKSIVADGVGDLYRCADKLGKGYINRGVWYYEQAKTKLGERLELEFDKNITDKNRLYWAEMALDEFNRLKRQF